MSRFPLPRKPLPRKAVPLAIGAVLALGIGGALVAVVATDSSSADKAAHGAPRLRIVDPYIPQPSSADVAAGYLIVQNDGDGADRLMSIASPLAGEVMLHRTAGNSMDDLDGLDVPAGGKGVLSRGGNHIMFVNPTKAVKKGDTVPVTLTFERFGSITVQVPVLGVTERPGDVPAAAAARTGVPTEAASSHVGD